MQICHLLQLSQWENNLKMHSLNKNLPIQRFCKKIRTNFVLAEIWSKQYQLFCQFAPLNNLDIYRNLVFFLIRTLYQRFIERFIKFFLLSLKELFIISITSAPFTIDWLANFWRWAILIGSFESTMNITKFNSLKHCQ